MFLWEICFTYKLLLLILNPYTPHMVRSDNPMKSYNSFHISHRREGRSEPPPPKVPTFYATAWNSNQNCSIDPYLQIGTKIETFASIWNKKTKSPMHNTPLKWLSLYLELRRFVIMNRVYSNGAFLTVFATYLFVCLFWGFQVTPTT